MTKEKISDIVLSATLLHNGASLDAITLDGTRGVFHLSNVNPIVLQDFAKRECWVEPYSFNGTIRRLNHQIRQLKERSFVTDRTTQTPN